MRKTLVSFFCILGVSVVGFSSAQNLQEVLRVNKAANISGDTTATVTGGEDAAQAYKFLCTVANQPCNPHIVKLNPKFAVCLAKMIQAGQAAGYSIRAHSAYRTPERQAQLKAGAIAAGRGHMVGSVNGSNHVKGLAVDLAAGGSSMGGFYYTPAGKWAHANAGRFGLHFRMMSPGLFEPWHIEPRGTDCNNGQMADSARSSFMDGFLGGGNNQGGAQSEVDRLMEQNRQAEARAQQQAQQDRVGAPQGGGGAGAPGAADRPPGEQGSAQQQSLERQLQENGASSALLPLSSATLSCAPERVNIGGEARGEWACPAGSTPRLVANKSTRIALPLRGGETSGVVSLRPQVNTEYLLSCIRNTQLVASAVCRVAVQAQPKTSALTIKASEVEVLKNETVDIEWSATQVKSGSCSVFGPGDFEATGSRGVAETGPLTASTNIFTLSCMTASGQPIEKSVTVKVVKKKSVVSEEEGW